MWTAVVLWRHHLSQLQGEARARVTSGRVPASPVTSLADSSFLLPFSHLTCPGTRGEDGVMISWAMRTFDKKPKYSSEVQRKKGASAYSSHTKNIHTNRSNKNISLHFVKPVQVEYRNPCPRLAARMLKPICCVYEILMTAQRPNSSFSFWI